MRSDSLSCVASLPSSPLSLAFLRAHHPPRPQSHRPRRGPVLPKAPSRLAAALPAALGGNQWPPPRPPQPSQPTPLALSPRSPPMGVAFGVPTAPAPAPRAPPRPPSSVGWAWPRTPSSVPHSRASSLSALPRPPPRQPPRPPPRLRSRPPPRPRAAPIRSHAARASYPRHRARRLRQIPSAEQALPAERTWPAAASAGRRSSVWCGVCSLMRWVAWSWRAKRARRPPRRRCVRRPCSCRWHTMR